MRSTWQTAGHPAGLADTTRSHPRGKERSLGRQSSAAGSSHPRDRSLGTFLVVTAGTAAAGLRWPRPGAPPPPCSAPQHHRPRRPGWGADRLPSPRSREPSARADTHKELIRTLKELKVHLPADRKAKGKASTLATLKYALRSVKQVKGTSAHTLVLTCGRKFQVPPNSARPVPAPAAQARRSGGGFRGS